jgi:hypothetical protein
VNDGLALAIMIFSLLLAGWCLVATGRQRWLDLTHLVGLAVLELALLAQTTIAAAAIARGERPVEFVTFLGYLVTSVLFVPLCAGLATMERTRWGSAIAAGGCLVAAVLTLRLQQVWQLHG